MSDTLIPVAHYDAIREEWRLLHTTFDVDYNRGALNKDPAARCRAMLRDIKRMVYQISGRDTEGYRRYYAVANRDVLRMAMEME